MQSSDNSELRLSLDRQGCSLSRVAIAWVLGHELAPLAIAAGADPGQAADNAAAADLVLTEPFEGDPERPDSRATGPPMSYQRS